MSVMTTLRIASLALCLPMIAQAAPYETGRKETPGKRMPVGDYECSLGSYKYKPCAVTEESGDFFLTVTAGARFPFRVQILPTDEKNQLILLGAPTAPGELCPTCPDDKVGTECAGDVAEKAACAAQPVHASMRKKGKVWSGDLLYYLVRGVRGDAKKGWFRLGITGRFRVRKAR